MPSFSKLPVVRALYRYWWELTRPSPLQEFSDYDAYWHDRIRDGKRAGVLDRHRIISRLIPDGTKVLDVGCGDGAFLTFLHDVRPSCRLMGVDVSLTAIGTLNKAGIDGKHIDPSRPLRQQLDGSWDYVVLMEVIEHVADAEGLVRQVLSLRPKRIFITIPNVGFLIYRLRLMFFGRFPVTSIFYHMREHLRFWTVKDFHQWANSLGTTITSYHGQVDRPDKLINWLARGAPSLFADRIVYELEPQSNGDEHVV